MSTDDGERKAREDGVLFMETSAKGGYNIKQLFRKLATTLPGASAATAASAAASGSVIDIKLQPVPPPPGTDGGACAC